MKAHGSQEVSAVTGPPDPLVLSLSKHERGFSLRSPFEGLRASEKERLWATTLEALG